MKLSKLLEGLAVALEGSADPDIADLGADSREIGPGWAFVALKGERSDGADFIPQALERGACAVFSQGAVKLPPGIAAGRFQGDPRPAMAALARRLHGNPDESLALIGVTGTNGKTTTTMLIRQLLRGAGRGCGLIGTVLNAAGPREQEAVRTTPESPSFYRWLRRSVESGDAASAVEVSSHALCLDRVAGAKFRVGVFTNLTQDHLDFHGDMEGYFEAKLRLRGQSARFLANVDDPYGQRLLGAPGVVSFALERDADYRLTDLRLDPTGTRFRLVSPKGTYSLESPLLGRFNAYNLLAALAACVEAGFELRDLIPAVHGVKGAPGRLDRVDCGQAFGVMVDYAHTPDALEKLLAEGKRMLPAGGRLHVLFGCGGDRDRSKRPLMAAAVAAGADVVWHSSDNTRGEDPERILDDAASGIPAGLRADPVRYHRIADRALAVEAAVRDCRPGDLLLLAGKGHEPYQEIRGIKHPYSDRAAAEAALRGTSVGRPWAATP
jgi:UDP-N-acetylmuramoyl-L-alanyl-D-glutamate--2,6-diaminopimelate ligase